MPKVKSYAAAWLSKPALGHSLFAPSTESAKASNFSPYAPRKKTPPGPRRTIARRGTEVFVAVGKELRWGDLAYLKENWALKQSKGRSGTRIKREGSMQSIDDDDGLGNEEEPNHSQGFRTIKIPVADDIRQLVISPNSTYMAILTAYTVHILLIPDPSHLTAEDTGPIKPKVFTLGPTTHVTSRSPIASALWHPLGVSGSCLVTVTADAIVRVWELSLTERWSFDSPNLAIDLKKLADGRSLDEDFTAPTSATNTAFSPDSFEMQVASATFASRGSGGWSPMTLWVAMREGDVYALCPLLPQRWAPPPTLVPSLSVSIVAKVAAIEDDPDVLDRAKLLAQQQLEWMGEIDSQEPQIIDAPPGEPLVEVYTRPSRPGTIPRLQGPFVCSADPQSEDDLDTELADILVIGRKIETDDLMMGEEDELDFEDGEQEGLSLSVICLLSTSGQVKLYLDLIGLEAQWLPPKNKAKLPGRSTARPEPPSLLTFQCLDTMNPVEVSDEAWPVFSTDVVSRYGFYVTHHAGITFVSLSPWVFRLESELQGDSEAGSDFRLNLLVNGQNSIRDRLFSQPSGDAAVPLAAAVAIRDPDVGYALLSATPYEPIVLTFESPEDEFSPMRQQTPIFAEDNPTPQPLDFYEPRPVYQPSHVFDEPSALPALMERLRTSRHKTIVNQEVRLSPLTLAIFTDAHKILSDETHRVGLAAAELFRRLEVLRAEFQRQISKANEIRVKIEKISGDPEDDGESDNTRFERRITEAQARQKSIGQRLEYLRKTVGKATSRELSSKEKAFIDEIKNMEASMVGSSTRAGGTCVGTKQKRQPGQRFDEIKQLKDALAADAEAIQRKEDGKGIDMVTSASDLRVPADVRRAKLQKILDLLLRETTLIEAASARLEHLQVNAP
jgi:nucleoporin NUP82